MDNKILKIIYSENFMPVKYKFHIYEYIISLFIFFKAKKIFKKENTLATIKYIDTLSKTTKKAFSSTENEIYNVRRIIKFLNIANFLHKRPLCLEYSLSLCAALMFLGFGNINLCIGRSLNYVGDYEFHSWLEIDNTTVNYRMNYKEMYTIVYHKVF